MQASLSRTLQHELSQIIHKHLRELSGYATISDGDAAPPGDILLCLQRLDEICRHTAPERARKLVSEARECQFRVENFLELMNQRLDPVFRETEIGQILERSRRWCRAALGEAGALPVESVWDHIAPAKPDHLEMLAEGVYEACWWKPVPQMDVYLLKHTDGVVIHEEIRSPRGLPQGLAVRFSLLPCTPALNPDC